MTTEPRTLTGPTDTVGPWTLKSVPTATREAVIRAAQRENLTVGQWLERRVNEWTAAGAPVAVQPVAADGASEAARLSLIQGTVASAVDLANAPGVPKKLRNKLNRALTEIVPTPRVAVASGVTLTLIEDSMRPERLAAD